MPEPRLKQVEADRSHYPMTNGAQQGALIAEGFEVAKEAIIAVGERYGAREELVPVDPSFHQARS